MARNLIRTGLAGFLSAQRRLGVGTFSSSRLNSSSSSSSSSSFASKIGDDFVVHSPAPDVDIPRQHFFDFVWTKSAKEFPDRIALVDYSSKRNFTFSESKDLSARCGCAVREIGMAKGDVLGLFLPNLPEYCFLLSGASLAGVPCTTINPTYKPGELAKQLDLSGAKAVATLQSFLPQVEQALKKLSDDQKKGFTIVVVDGEEDSPTDSSGVRRLSYRRLLARCAPLDLSEAEDFDFDVDPVALPFSSGTTGPPKGVELTHRNLVANGRQLVYGEGFDFLPFPTESLQVTTICVLPMFHIFGLNVVSFPGLHMGEQVVMMPGFDPAAFAQALQDVKPYCLFLVPPLVGFCANHPMVTPAHLEHSRSVFVGAAPVGVALIEKFKQKAPHMIFREGWGMTELSPVAMMTPLKDEVKGSCGLALPSTKFKVVDLENSDKNLGPGETGELCVKGPQVMKGYLNNPSATAAAITPDGWLHSGDIAYYDESGHVFIVDRLKELIKVKGFQVPPAELEDLLRTHPAVSDVAVAGIPHDRLGEAPRAYVVRREGNDNVDEEQIRSFVADEVAEYKRLEGGVRFVEAIPKSASGKILRKDLRTTFDGDDV